MISSLILSTNAQNYCDGNLLLDFLKMTSLWKNENAFHPVPKLEKKKLSQIFTSANYKGNLPWYLYLKILWLQIFAS